MTTPSDDSYAIDAHAVASESRAQSRVSDAKLVETHIRNLELILESGWAPDDEAALEAGIQALRSVSGEVVAPIGYVSQATIDRLKNMHSGAANTKIANVSFAGIGCVVPLYAHPVQGVGVTDEMVDRFKAEFAKGRGLMTPDSKFVRRCLSAALTSGKE